MKSIVLALACACALALAPAAVAQTPADPVAPAAASAKPTAKPAPKRFRSAYRQWRHRLQFHNLHVGRNLLVQGTRPRAAEVGAPVPSKRELRRSIHRMQKRWNRWLRHDPRGVQLSYKLKVREQVPAWGAQHLRSIAWCESKNDPRAIGGGGAYRGMYQFSFSTWAVVGGSGDPVAASRWEQTWRAWLLLSRYGSGHWPICG